MAFIGSAVAASIALAIAAIAAATVTISTWRFWRRVWRRWWLWHSSLSGTLDHTSRVNCDDLSQAITAAHAKLG